MTLLTLATCAHNLAMPFARWLPWLSTYPNDTSWVSSYHFLRYFICWSSRPLLQMVCPSKAYFTRRREVNTMRAVVTAGTTTTTYSLNTTISSDVGDRKVERAITTVTCRIATWEVTSTQRALTGQSADHWGQDVIPGWEEKGIVESGHIRDVQATLPDELHESVQARLQTGMSAEVKYI